ncbi:unnamed protein product [Anisakis simplex]|uniref:MFS domain-containing protein n=1 Tax=Anisakis simplex TaxID=6269 RepID=A0A0M3JWS1_ANISI|nr:unnamed protein product [Anisakis simplex]
MDTNDILLKRIPRKYHAYLVMLGSVIIQLSTGIVYTLGNLLPYILSYLRWRVDPGQSESSMIWLQMFLGAIPFAMLAGGFLQRKLPIRVVVFLGVFLYTFSIAISYLTIQYSFGLLLITFGLCTGFAQGFTYNCILTNIQEWFPNRIGFATGMVVGGFGLSAFIFTPIQTKFINPNNYSVNEDGIFTQEDLLRRVPQVFLVMAIIFAVFQSIGLILLAKPVQEYELIGGSFSVQSEFSHHSQQEGEDLLVKNHGDTSGGNGNDSGNHQWRDIFKSSTFIILFVTLFLNNTWAQIVSGLYKAYGQTFIKDDFYLAMIGSIASIFNCGSRVLAGQASYQTSMIIVCGIGSALMSSLCLVRYIGIWWVFTYWVCFMFSCIGATYTLLPYATNKYFRSEQFGVVYGCLQLALPLGGIFAAILTELILPYLGYNILLLFVSSLMFVSLILTANIHRTRHA